MTPLTTPKEHEMSYTIAAKCGSNPDCMILRVSGDEAVAQLAAVFPALAECGGYDGQLLDPDCRHDLLEYRGGKQCDNVWGGRVWASQASEQWIDVTIKVCRDDDHNKVMITRTHSRVLRGQDVVVTRPYTGKSWRNPRPNVRREVAKAVANFLTVTCTVEALAERAERAELEAAQRARWVADHAAQVAHQTERMVAMGRLSGSVKTEAGLRAVLAKRTSAAAGDWHALKGLARQIEEAVAHRYQTLTAAQRSAWIDIDQG